MNNRFLVISTSAFALFVYLIVSEVTVPTLLPIKLANLVETDGFYEIESNGEQFFRWTKSESIFYFPGFETASSLYVTLRLTAPQYPGAIPVTAQIQVDDSSSINFNVSPTWRHYHILVRITEPSWHQPVLRLTADSWVPGIHDSRQLGIAVSGGIVQRFGPPRLLAILERVLFLTPFVVLFFSITRRCSNLIIIMATVCVVLLDISNVFRLKYILSTDWSTVGEIIAAIIAVEALHSRQRIPRNFHLGIAITGVGTGTMLISELGWIIAGATFLVCGASLAAVAINYPSQKPSLLSLSSPNRWLNVALSCIIAVVLAVLLVTGLEDIDSHYHGDESLWVPIGVQAFRMAFIDRDLDHPFWFDYLHSFGSPNPQISKYIIGAGTYLAGHHDLPVLMYDFRQDYAWNKTHGRVLPPEIAKAARFPIALTGAMSGVFLYWLGVQVAGYVTGIIAVVLFITTPVVWSYARLAMLDIPALMFGLLALNLCIRAITALHSNAPNAGILIMASGIASGAAAGAKLNGLLIPGICALAICITGITYPNRSDRYKIISGAVSILLWAYVVFFLSNPRLYPDPITGIQGMLELSRIVTGSTPPTIESRITMVWKSLGEGGFSVSGILFSSQLWLIIGAITLSRSLRHSSGARFVALLAIVCWGVITFTGITLWIPLPRDRYFLPLVPIVALIQAYGIATVLHSTVRLLFKFRSHL